MKDFLKTLLLPWWQCNDTFLPARSCNGKSLSCLLCVFCSCCYVLYIFLRNLLSPNLVCASRYIETALCMVQMTAIFYCALVLGKNALNDALLLVRFSRCPRKGVKTPFSWERNLELCVIFLYTLRYCRTNKKFS